MHNSHTLHRWTNADRGVGTPPHAHISVPAAAVCLSLLPQCSGSVSTCAQATAGQPPSSDALSDSTRCEMRAVAVPSKSTERGPQQAPPEVRNLEKSLLCAFVCASRARLFRCHAKGCLHCLTKFRVNRTAFHRSAARSSAGSVPINQAVPDRQVVPTPFAFF